MLIWNNKNSSLIFLLDSDATVVRILGGKEKCLEVSVMFLSDERVRKRKAKWCGRGSEGGVDRRQGGLARP